MAVGSKEDHPAQMLEHLQLFLGLLRALPVSTCCFSLTKAPLSATWVNRILPYQSFTQHPAVGTTDNIDQRTGRDECFHAPPGSCIFFSNCLFSPQLLKSLFCFVFFFSLWLVVSILLNFESKRLSRDYYMKSTFCCVLGPQVKRCD